MREPDRIYLSNGRAALPETAFMTDEARDPRETYFRLEATEFWSGDLGLTLVTISLVILIFVVTPFHESGTPGRIILDIIIVALMIFAALTIEQSHLATGLVIACVIVTAAVLMTGRVHPTLFLHQAGSILSTMTLLLYVRIVLVVMFRAGPVTWSRIQGGVSAYLLLGMAWASAFTIVEEFDPGAFHFVTAPVDFDQLISKLTYFSFCTLTTVGSEISPINPFARSLTTAEAVTGQLFPAILIGALVAMAMQSRRKA
jgi:hypothetical protein